MISPRKNNYNQFLAISQSTQEELEKNYEFFSICYRFHPSHPQQKVSDASFCTLVGFTYGLQN